MKRNFIYLILAFAVLFSCEREKAPAQSVGSEQDKREVTIVAKASETKTVLDENNAVLWKSGDKVSLVLVSADQAVSNYTEVFTTEDDGATATFNGTLQNDIFVGESDKYQETAYVVYPSSAVNEDGQVVFELQSERTVAPGSFPSGMNLSSAAVSLDGLVADSSVEATLLNAFAIIRFQVSEDVKSLKITGTSPVSGQAPFSFNADGRLVMGESDDVVPYVTVTPAEGDEFVAGQTYNLLVFPGEHKSVTVELTDTDGCKYSKTLTGAFNFAAARFYTFNFNSSFGKDFTFSVSGADLEDDSKIMAVFDGADETDAYEAAVNSNSVTINIPHGENLTSGYAVYPSSVYSEGEICFELDATDPDAVGFYWGKLSTSDQEIVLKGVKSDEFAKLTFTVPAGVARYTVASDKPLYGAAEATVADGVLNVVPAAGADMSFDGTATATAQTFCVFPLSDATVTVTMYDAAGASYAYSETVTVAKGGVATLDIPETFEFGKSGSFGTDDFNPGGTYEF